MSIFDPNLLLDETTEQVSERRPPLPVGEYQAIIGEVEAKPWSKDDGSSGMRLILPIKIVVPPAQAESLGYSELTLRDGGPVDLTPNGSVDYSKGKNNKIRAYRDATDLNKSGERFNLRMLTGRMVKVVVQHELYEGNLQERVKGVAKA